jgi:hypothetical protein
VGTGEKITSPRPHETIAVEDLPDSFTWSDIDGVNYLTVKGIPFSLLIHALSLTDAF